MAFIFFAAVLVFIVYFLFIRARLQKPTEETESVPLAQRRRGLASRMRQLEDEENTGSGPENESSGEEEGELSGEEGELGEDEHLSKREMNKLIKKREKEKRKKEQEAERAEREARLEQKRQHQSDKYRKREEERLAREAEEKKLEEEQKKKEEEEYAKWKTDFAVEQAGAEAEEDQAESQSKLAAFIEYIASRKVVPLNDLAAEFSMQTMSVIDRIKDLEKAGRLSGIMDDRGKYIYISPEEFKAIAEFVKKVGRISKTDLVRECNRLVKLKAEEKDKQKMQDEVAALERELENIVAVQIDKAPEETKVGA